MKRADIKPGLDAAVKAKAHKYSRETTLMRGRVVAAGNEPGYYVVYIQPARGNPRNEVLHQNAIIEPWPERIARALREEKKAKQEREKQNAAWEAKRAEERTRFEQHILPAFKGLTTVNYVSGRAPDLADYIEDMMLRSGSSTVELRETDLRGIADRILELRQIVEQNALVASDPPEAGHTPLTRMQVLEQELDARLKREAELQNKED
jgi:hypothetical protein